MSPDERLEATQFDTFWIPDDVSVVEEEGLLLMHCPRGDTNYNVVLRLRAAGRERALVQRILSLHEGRTSLVPVNSVNHTPALEAALTDAGYRCEVQHHAYVCAVDAYQGRDSDGIEGRIVRTMPELEAFQTVNQRAFGKSVQRTRSEMEQFLRDGLGPRIRRVVAWDGEQPVAAGGITAHPRVGMGFLWAGGTVEEARRRGAYSAVMAGRIAWARQVGLPYVGLYARVDTSAPVVEAQGFQRHGFMDFWRRGV